MLEDFFVVPAAARRLRDGALGFCLDGFCARLVELGYRPTTIRYRLWVVRNLTAWMIATRVPVTDLDEGASKSSYAHGDAVTSIAAYDGRFRSCSNGFALPARFPRRLQ